MSTAIRDASRKRVSMMRQSPRDRKRICGSRLPLAAFLASSMLTLTIAPATAGKIPPSQCPHCLLMVPVIGDPQRVWVSLPWFVGPAHVVCMNLYDDYCQLQWERYVEEERAYRARMAA